jgi:WD40 repeat protein
MASQRQLLLVDLDSGSADVIFTGYVIEWVAMSANGAWAVTTSVPPDWDYSKHDWNGPRTLRLFDLEQRLCVRTWQAHRAFISDLALSADGRFLATASRDRTVKLVDLRNAVTLGSWRCARGVEAVALTSSGHRLAYVSRGGVLTVRGRNGGVVGRYTNCGAEPGCVALSKNGNKIVVAIGGEVSVVDVRKATRFGPFAGTQPYQESLAIDDQAHHAITGELGHQLVLWDLKKMSKAKRPGEWISGIWAGSDKALVHQGSLSIWDYSPSERAGFRLARHCEVTAAPSAGFWAMAKWSPTGGGRIRVGKWGQRQTKPLLESRELSRAMLSSMHFSRNGKRLIVHTHKFGCRVLEVSTGRTVWKNGNLGLGVRPYLSPSGTYLFCCWYSGKVEVRLTYPFWKQRYRRTEDFL